MSGPVDPWSDPAGGTGAGAPYAGPPVTAPASSWGTPAPYGWPPASPYGAAPYGWPPAGPYGMPWPPQGGPRLPGQVIAAAVLAFVQAGVVALTSAYVFLLASVFTLAAAEPGFPGDGEALATEASVLAALQVVSVIVLVAGGILALNRRSPGARRTLLAALGAQVALALYWAVRLLALAEGAVGSNPSAVLLFAVFCFAAAPAVGLGLLVGRPAREWFGGTPGEGTTQHR
ncbi:hypothetical protein [Geodermatophilus ruber]|uniref:Uncharacterized protein n=1 Tax=Geodermatophilus ruber TaxID=504800 RepID=A0A1I4FJV8_9ACTN|nr:hypothetical protein [Geodermatophilus ruber]SFL18204.1 hypothetical protein SAMN04488085_107210 [Geodermatophilus ruber]